ncbi:MAG: hypothetical protein LBR37_03790 [Erysipelotrichaceae bacterium]|jgi:hypothetical protein|nr:hypothetical protein [Erysipelotrichaceae bacterium]
MNYYNLTDYEKRQFILACNLRDERSLFKYADMVLEKFFSCYSFGDINRLIKAMINDHRFDYSKYELQEICRRPMYARR